MAISINDRQLITQFITNTQNLNVNLPTNGGGCANLGTVVKRIKLYNELIANVI